jgi:dinuclear metal center YbgI/SA1388 family protein
LSKRVESLSKKRDFWHYIRVVPAPLTELLAAVEKLAPLSFAEAWDNVGLLLEPTQVDTAPSIAAALLTIDLTDEVVNEAEALGAGLIIAYHPPIFQGLKRLRSSAPGERVLLRCAAHGVAIFSPHTALDAAPGGVNDWLLGAFGSGLRQPCLPDARDVRFGPGRSLRLEEPITLAQAVSALKAQLGLAQLRVAAADQHAAGERSIRSIAVCAGAGGSLFEKLPSHDLFVTGEMRHHDVRARVLAGSSVVLSEHTHTERGYLPVLAARLTSETGGKVPFHVSRCDRDPLSIV